MREYRKALVYGLVLFLLLLAFYSLTVGAMPLSWLTFWQLMTDKDTGSQDIMMMRYVLIELRLPRVLAAVVIGAGLAVAGVVTQGLFRNPLADPGLMGVSSGAALGAVGIIVLGHLLPWGSTPFFLLPVAAFWGGLLATLAVCLIANVNGQSNTGLLLLAGIAINALAGALIGVLAYVANDAQLRDLTFWTMGSIARVPWQQLLLVAPLIAIASAMLLSQYRALNSLVLGEEVAAHIGYPIPALKRSIIVLVALITGSAVAVSGVIGFIGLMVPHIARTFVGADHRWLLPVSLFTGACLLVFADILARVMAAPAEIPVGLLMSMIGAPFFIYLLLRQRGKIVF